MKVEAVNRRLELVKKAQEERFIYGINASIQELERMKKLVKRKMYWTLFKRAHLIKSSMHFIMEDCAHLSLRAGKRFF